MYLSAIEQIGVLNPPPIVRPEKQIVNSSEESFLRTYMKEPAQISTYFLPIDSEISQKILMVDDVIKAYLS